MLEGTKKMNLGPQMAKIRLDIRKGVNFQHWTIWGTPLKIQILKIGFVHAREDQKICQEPKCIRWGGPLKGGYFFTLDPCPGTLQCFIIILLS